MNNDEKLEELLKQSRSLPDDGFSQKVLRNLPNLKKSPRRFLVLQGSLMAACLVVVILTQPQFHPHQARSTEVVWLLVLISLFYGFVTFVGISEAWVKLRLSSGKRFQ